MVYAVGDRVEALSNRAWYRGQITKVRRGRSKPLYDVVYVEGGKDCRVKTEDLKPEGFDEDEALLEQRTAQMISDGGSGGNVAEAEAFMASLYGGGEDHMLAVERSATTIQGMERCRQGRKRVQKKREDAGARRLQGAERQRQARRKVQRRRESQAATTLQNAERGRRARAEAQRRREVVANM
jgi:hypothetical protein